MRISVPRGGTSLDSTSNSRSSNNNPEEVHDSYNNCAYLLFEEMEMLLFFMCWE
jgi:hypothetical protein